MAAPTTSPTIVNATATSGTSSTTTTPSVFILQSSIFEGSVEDCEVVNEHSGGDDPISALEGVTTAIVVSMLALLAAVENVCLIATIAWNRDLRRNNTSFLLLSLGVSDLVMAVFVMPLTAHSMWHGAWGLDCKMCYVHQLVNEVVVRNVQLTLGAVSLKRYFMVFSLEWYNRTFRDLNIVLHIAVTWTLSVATSLPVHFGVGATHMNSQKLFCEVWGDLYSPYLWICITVFSLALLLILYTNTSMFLKFYRAKKQMELLQRERAIQMGLDPNQLDRVDHWSSAKGWSVPKDEVARRTEDALKAAGLKNYRGHSLSDITEKTESDFRKSSHSSQLGSTSFTRIGGMPLSAAKSKCVDLALAESDEEEAPHIGDKQPSTARSKCVDLGLTESEKEDETHIGDKQPSTARSKCVDLGLTESEKEEEAHIDDKQPSTARSKCVDLGLTELEKEEEMHIGDKQPRTARSKGVDLVESDEEDGAAPTGERAAEKEKSPIPPSSARPVRSSMKNPEGRSVDKRHLSGSGSGSGSTSVGFVPVRTAVSRPVDPEPQQGNTKQDPSPQGNTNRNAVDPPPQGNTNQDPPPQGNTNRNAVDPLPQGNTNQEPPPQLGNTNQNADKNAKEDAGSDSVESLRSELEHMPKQRGPPPVVDGVRTRNSVLGPSAKKAGLEGFTPTSLIKLPKKDPGGRLAGRGQKDTSGFRPGSSKTPRFSLLGKDEKGTDNSPSSTAVDSVSHPNLTRTLSHHRASESSHSSQKVSGKPPVATDCLMTRCDGVLESTFNRDGTPFSLSGSRRMSDSALHVKITDLTVARITDIHLTEEEKEKIKEELDNSVRNPRGSDATAPGKTLSLPPVKTADAFTTRSQSGAFWKGSRELAASTFLIGLFPLKATYYDPTPSGASTASLRKKLSTRARPVREDVHIISTFTTVVAVFIVCFVPMILVTAWERFHRVYHDVKLFAWCLYFANSVLDPLIYGLGDLNVRNGFRILLEDVLTCLRGRQRGSGGQRTELDIKEAEAGGVVRHYRMDGRSASV